MRRLASVRRVVWKCSGFNVHRNAKACTVFWPRAGPLGLHSMGRYPVPSVYYVMAPTMAHVIRMYFDFNSKPSEGYEASAKTSENIAHILKHDAPALLSMSTEAKSMMDLFEVVLPGCAASEEHDPKIHALSKKITELYGLGVMIEQHGTKPVAKLLTTHLEQCSTLAEPVSNKLQELLNPAEIDKEAVAEYVTNGGEATELFAAYVDWKAVTTARNKFVQKMNLETNFFQACADAESALWPAVKLAVLHCSLLAAALRPLNPKENRKKVIDAARKHVKDIRVDVKLDALVRQLEADAE